mgnify:CR=1 FL=1
MYAEHAPNPKADAKPLFLQKTLTASLNTNRFGGAERDRTADPLLAKQVLSQLSYSPIQLDRPGHHVQGSATLPASVFPRRAPSKMVGPGRLELPTPRLSSVCSNQLSYGPILVKPVRTIKTVRIDAVLCLLEERETWTARLAISSGLKVSVTYCVRS